MSDSHPRPHRGGTSPLPSDKVRKPFGVALSDEERDLADMVAWIRELILDALQEETGYMDDTRRMAPRRPMPKQTLRKTETEAGKAPG
jgi:hypothetical protein